MRKNIEKKCDSKKLEINITQIKYDNIEEFFKDLNNNKEFYIINKELWLKICKEENKNEEGIKCKFKNKNCILNFNNIIKNYYNIPIYIFKNQGNYR